MITCAMCGRSYDADQSAGACSSCVLITKGCGRVKCPHCGYENQRPLMDAFSQMKDRWKELLHGSRK
ncbi:MAG: hypothetical protein ACP5VF_00785 [Acidobacteriota bacterium]